MFDRFGVGSPPLFGVRGGMLAIAAHATILAFGLHRTTGNVNPAGPYVAPESIWVLPQAPRRGVSVRCPHRAGTPRSGRGHSTDRADRPDDPRHHHPGGIYPSHGPGWQRTDGRSQRGLRLRPGVEQPPELLASPPPRYPKLIREAHIEGVVIVEGVVDTLGRMERQTLRVMSSPHPVLSASAIECLGSAVFRPGRVEGTPVRVLVQVPVRFTIAER